MDTADITHSADEAISRANHAIVDCAEWKHRCERQDNLVNRIYGIMSHWFACSNSCPCDRCMEDIADVIGRYKQGID